MVFIDSNGEEIITINELFRSKKFVRAKDSSYFLFLDYNTGKKEIWTFVDNLFMYIPIGTNIQKIKEIVSNSGWCKKVNDNYDV